MNLCNSLMLKGLTLFLCSGLPFILHASFETDTCDSVIQAHIDVVKKSDEFIFSLAVKKPTDVTPVDITLLKDNLVDRYQHLENTKKTYLDEKSSCPNPVIAKALAVYDYHHFGKTALSSGHIRRAIKSISKYDEYGLSELEKNYRRAVSKKNLTKLKKELDSQIQPLPQDLDLPTLDRSNRKGHFFNLSDSLLGVTSKSVSSAAFFWGVLSDHLKWRDGRIFGSETAKQIMLDSLKPLDILFEKRTFVLSNYTIPGHWGHVAVYLGKKNDLITLGVWDDPGFTFFRQKVEEGYEIVEIRKSGMNFVKLDDFLNLDEIAVMRVKEIPLAITEVYANLALQAKKKYDFQFNAHTTHEITCTELITNSFGDIKWKQSKNLGLVNMQPDDIAELTLREDAPAEIIIYLKGMKKFIDTKDESDWRELFE